MNAILKRAKDNKFYLWFGKNRKTTDFVSPQDCQIWQGAMKSAGLYTDLTVMFDDGSGLKPLEPNYDPEARLMPRRAKLAVEY